jgi:thioredoxin 1
MAGNVAEFTDANFDTEVLQSKVPVLVDFWAPWCGPCRMLAPTIEELASEYNGRVKVGKLNTDESPETAGQYSISSIPTILLFKEGKVADRLVGVNPKARFQQILNKA